MSEFWVVGGEYETTEFKNLAKGVSEVREGPFENYEDAVKCWQTHAWATVDNAMAHFHIEEAQSGLPDSVSETQYWVIGGSFENLDFANWSDATDTFGPYMTYAEAEKNGSNWRGKRLTMPLHAIVSKHCGRTRKNQPRN